MLLDRLLSENQMIEMESIEFQNFLSYGNYPTKIPLSKLGPCLITGEICDESDDTQSSDFSDMVQKRSNGAGKSTSYNPILWALFGRTMHSPRPGDRIINNKIGKDCYAKLTLKNGDVITRTRKMSGHNELLVERNGESLMSTLSVTPHQQLALNRLYGLDWHIFCNSSFFTQYNRPWFELPDPQRKKELERALRLDRLTFYATTAKTKVDAATKMQEGFLEKKENIAEQIASLHETITETRAIESTFEDDKKRRSDEALVVAKQYAEKARDLDVPDIKALEEQWKVVNEARTLLKTMEQKARTYRTTAQNHRNQAQNLRNNANLSIRRKKAAEAKITAWRNSAGKMCLQCEQSIAHTHTEEKIIPYQHEIAEATDEAAEFERQASEQDELATTYDERAKKQDVSRSAIETQIVESSPNTTVDTAKALMAQKNNLIDTAKRWKATAESINKEINPHLTTIEKLNSQIAKKTEQLEVIEKDLLRSDQIIKHTSYIYKSYHDRRKIKSFSMAKRRPFLNSRLRYYLDKFRLGVNMEITDSLTIDTSGPGYEFMSGGERTRANVAFMLARFDAHEAAYGRQSNIVILDEVDGRLDEEGVECLIDVVHNDIAPRVDAVLVVSHRMAMRGSFPHQIIVRKENGFSVLSEVR